MSRVALLCISLFWAQPCFTEDFGLFCETVYLEYLKSQSGAQKISYFSGVVAKGLGGDIGEIDILQIDSKKQDPHLFEIKCPRPNGLERALSKGALQLQRLKSSCKPNHPRIRGFSNHNVTCDIVHRATMHVVLPKDYEEQLTGSEININFLELIEKLEEPVLFIPYTYAEIEAWWREETQDANEGSVFAVPSMMSDLAWGGRTSQEHGRRRGSRFL